MNSPGGALPRNLFVCVAGYWLANHEKYRAETSSFLPVSALREGSCLKYIYIKKNSTIAFGRDWEFCSIAFIWIKLSRLVIVFTHSEVRHTSCIAQYRSSCAPWINSCCEFLSLLRLLVQGSKLSGLLFEWSQPGMSFSDRKVRTILCSANLVPRSLYLF